MISINPITKLIQLFLLTFTALCIISSPVIASPRVWSVQPQSTSYVIASNTAQLLTATFNPRNLNICNDAATGGSSIYVNYSGVTAASMTVALVTTIKINPSECYNVTFNDQNALNTFTVAIMTNSSTADYRIIGVRP